nr:MAG TPA: hypothetical protein [Bacteriophage sp.]
MQLIYLFVIFTNITTLRVILSLERKPLSLLLLTKCITWKAQVF